ncbi:ELM2 domain-containing protein [Actinidia rufa]|uniref:ELM2 domain-containing protein n=1 Tax=Actinidia rufa TaxID=165716 RepID=A0A7J0H211_9ERIC|nr:ELM2 domain-containing protein [Actinidia rufa]
MVQKRPFGNVESYEVSSKHPRQQEYSNHLVSSREFVRAKDEARQPNISGGVTFTDDDENHTGGIITERPMCTQKNSETSIRGSISNTSRASSSTTEEDYGSEAPFHFLFSLEYCNPDRPTRTFICSEEIHAQKVVPVGPDFQADVPEWGASDGIEPLTTFARASELDLIDCKVVETKLTEICVIPMPEFGSSAYNDDKVGDGRSDCYCVDSGSFRCVRQHVKEAREKLWRTLGQERFSKLGFSDVGEVVADKWSQEEELLFCEGVFSNPASLDKKFWDHLSRVFPSRSKRDIVNYYFNVFMLQIRAVQNRSDPMNIDSDNDEWHWSDDSGDDGVGTAEEDEDSVVESPLCHDDLGPDEILENDSHEYNDDVLCPGYNFENIVVGYDEGTIDVLETCSPMLLSNCSPDHLWDEKGNFALSRDKKGDRDVQDDSCTSDDTGIARQVRQLKANNSKWHLGSFESKSGGDSNEFALEHCDT